MSSVEKVAITVTMSDGSEHTVFTHHPSPGGGNPAFVGQQVANAVGHLEDRLHRIVVADYGRQVIASSMVSDRTAP